MTGQGICLVLACQMQNGLRKSLEGEDGWMEPQSDYKLIRHRPGAPGLRLGLGPGLEPVQALIQLQELLDQHSFWAQGRSLRSLAQMLRHSAAITSVWQGRTLVGFGRASSDSRFRAVLWDVVIAGEHQGLGLGRRVVMDLINSRRLAKVERIYLMTTNSSGFYDQLGFEVTLKQQLLVRRCASG